jgi:hypothetical protein
MERTVKENMIIWVCLDGSVDWLRCTCSGIYLQTNHLIRIYLYRIFYGYYSTAPSALLSTKNHLPSIIFTILAIFDQMLNGALLFVVFICYACSLLLWEE